MVDFLGTRVSPEIVTLDTTDHIHAGLSYEVSNIGNVPSGGTLILVGETGAIPVHFHGIEITTNAGPLTIELIENPTISVAGAPITSFNRNRLSANVSSMAVSGGATITGGTVISISKIHGVGGGAHTQGDVGGISDEWDLKTDAIYAIRLTAGAVTGGIDYSAVFHWYELERQ